MPFNNHEPKLDMAIMNNINNINYNYGNNPGNLPNPNTNINISPHHHRLPTTSDPFDLLCPPTPSLPPPDVHRIEMIEKQISNYGDSPYIVSAIYGSGSSDDVNNAESNNMIITPTINGGGEFEDFTFLQQGQDFKSLNSMYVTPYDSPLLANHHDQQQYMNGLATLQQSSPYPSQRHHHHQLRRVNSEMTNEELRLHQEQQQQIVQLQLQQQQEYLAQQELAHMRQHDQFQIDRQQYQKEQIQREFQRIQQERMNIKRGDGNANGRQENQQQNMQQHQQQQQQHQLQQQNLHQLQYQQQQQHQQQHQLIQHHQQQHPHNNYHPPPPAPPPPSQSMLLTPDLEHPLPQPPHQPQSANHQHQHQQQQYINQIPSHSTPPPIPPPISVPTPNYPTRASPESSRLPPHHQPPPNLNSLPSPRAPAAMPKSKPIVFSNMTPAQIKNNMIQKPSLKKKQSKKNLKDRSQLIENGIETAPLIPSIPMIPSNQNYGSSGPIPAHIPTAQPLPHTPHKFNQTTQTSSPTTIIMTEKVTTQLRNRESTGNIMSPTPATRLHSGAILVHEASRSSPARGIFVTHDHATPMTTDQNDLITPPIQPRSTQRVTSKVTPEMSSAMSQFKVVLNSNEASSNGDIEIGGVPTTNTFISSNPASRRSSVYSSSHTSIPSPIPSKRQFQQLIKDSSWTGSSNGRTLGSPVNILPESDLSARSDSDRSSVDFIAEPTVIEPRVGVPVATSAITGTIPAVSQPQSQPPQRPPPPSTLPLDDFGLFDEDSSWIDKVAKSFAWDPFNEARKLVDEEAVSGSISSSSQ